MVRLLAFLTVLLLGAVILSPIIMALELEAMPGDFVLTWNNQHYNVPLIWSLCASGVLTLLYWLYRR